MKRKMKKILKNVYITCKDGYVTFFDAIYIDNKKIIFGKFSEKDVFIEYGGIPKENIEKIVILNKEGINQNNNFKRIYVKEV